MEEKFAQMVPALTEMERLLINRKNPEERERVLQYYGVVIRNISREIDGRFLILIASSTLLKLDCAFN